MEKNFLEIFFSLFSRGGVNYLGEGIHLKNQPARLFFGTKLFLCHVCLFLGK